MTSMGIIATMMILSVIGEIQCFESPISWWAMGNSWLISTASSAGSLTPCLGEPLFCLLLCYLPKPAEKFAHVIEPYIGYGEGGVVATMRIFGPAHDVITILAIFADGNITVLKDSYRGRYAGICFRCPGTWVVSVLVIHSNA